MRYFVLLIFMFPELLLSSLQDSITIRGLVMSNFLKTPLSNVSISLEGVQTFVINDEDGYFKIETELKGEYILHVFLKDYIIKRIPILLENESIELGLIFLERDITMDKVDNLIVLTDAELLNDEVNSSTVGLLQATRDIFLSRAAFDFGQAFFKVRGYDSQNGTVLLNGIPMNKFYDGRPQWNNFGGLNDVIRNQQFTPGLQPSSNTFGSLLGTTNIDTRPSGLRPGTRLTYSSSNRTYSGRLMATYNSGLKNNRIAYSISASRRWAKEGYVAGTLYDAYSMFGAFEYRFNKAHSINFTGILAFNRRGRSSALTEEVFKLAGRRYNPYWGKQNSRIRNARERSIAEPILMLNHFYKSKKVNINSGIMYQFGATKKSRIGYFNAPNPDPTYYRYLPSFYINSPIGANFISANSAKNGFLNRHQINWNKMYQANSNEKAMYVLYDDVGDNSQMTVNSTANFKMNEALRIDLGFRKVWLSSNNYAQINDLMGADYHEDIDPFSNTRNNISGSTRKIKDDIFNYHYGINISQLETFLQAEYTHKKWNSSISAKYLSTNYQRDGYFQNERFLENSIGKSEKISFANYGFKTSFTYNLSGRHWLKANGAYFYRAPVMQNVFVNPRENNTVVPDLQNERISSVALNYYLRLPKLTGRMTAYYTRFQNTTDVNFFFVDSGLGSDFVQEVITDFDKLHKGVELGLEYQLSSAVQLTFVAAVGKYLNANDPLVTINFDTSGTDERLINEIGTIDLGQAKLKNYKLAQGPQQAFSLGVSYRDPKYWWISTTANYLADNYANISTILRTSSFYLDPDTGTNFPEATEENVNKLLEQKPLDNFYLLNLIAGKSWLKNGKYISIFASVNNLFDTVFRTGGYEQSRNGNFGQLQHDNLSGTPSFAPKYWYGYGRTYFLNIAYSF